MNALIVAAIINLAKVSRTAQHKELEHTARVIAASVEAQLQRYLAIGRALSTSPLLFEEDLNGFRAQASAALPDTSEAWIIVSDPDGQKQLSMSLLPLVRRFPEAIAAQSRAFAAGSPIIAGVFWAPNHQKWITTVECPIFREGKPFRELTVSMSAESFSRFFDAQQLPEGWIGGIADTTGHYIAMTSAAVTGQPVFEGWRQTLGQGGLSRFLSPGGDEMVIASEVSPLSGWTVAVAAKRSVLEAPVRSTLRWAISSGIAVLLSSLVFAIIVARGITGPLRDLEKKASALVGGRPVTMADGIPEVERVWWALQTAVIGRRRLEQDLRVSEELLRTAAESGRFAAHDYDAGTGQLQWTPQLERIVGRDFAGLIVTPDIAASFIHPGDREKTIATVLEWLKGKRHRYELEFRILRPNGEVRWVLDRGQVIRDPVSGRPLRVTGVLLDITGRKQAELRQQNLLKELNHRVKNTLAIVQSIARQTLHNTKEPAAFEREFSERLTSLASAHNLLTQGAWEGASLEAIVRQATAPFVAGAGEDVFEISGPPVDIPANSTITLTLMFHELSSNAAKYGALSVPNGRVNISWETGETDHGKDLCVLWTEEGGPEVREPAKQGFGNRLLTMSAEQLDGTIQIAYNKSGLRCQLRLPLPAAESGPLPGSPA